MPLSGGNVRQTDFIDIWNDSEVFRSLRAASLKGKCGDCEFRLICGGCRARAYASQGQHLEEDPWCGYSPHGGSVIAPPAFEEVAGATTNDAPVLLWTEEAECRLKKVPSFVRSMVRRAVEKYALENNCRKITTEMMEELKQKAGMGGMGGHR